MELGRASSDARNSEQGHLDRIENGEKTGLQLYGLALPQIRLWEVKIFVERSSPSI
jgi:hypothetical protein